MAQPYTREEIRLSAKTTYCEGLIPSRVLATVEQGFAPEEPTDEELDLWASSNVVAPIIVARAAFKPSGQLDHALVLAQTFHLGVQITQRSDRKLSVIGFVHEGNPERAKTFRLYEGLSLTEAAHDITLHLWRVNHGDELW